MGRAHWKQGLGDVQGPMLRNVWAPERGPGRPLLRVLPELTASCLDVGCQLGRARQSPAHSQSGLAGRGPQAVARSYRCVSQESGQRAPYPKKALTLGRLQARSAEPSRKQGVSGEGGVGHSDKLGIASVGQKNHQKQQSSLKSETGYITYTKEKLPLKSTEPGNFKYYVQNQVEAICRDTDFCFETLSSKL